MAANNMHAMNEIDCGITGTPRKLLWELLAPVRWYIRRFPWARGKGLLVRWLIIPALPRDASFLVQVHGGARVRMRSRETLGLSTILYGPFEQAELDYLCGRVGAGSHAMDVGANVGLYSVAIGNAVGPSGEVLAIEPLPANVECLRKNLAENGLDNVRIIAGAVAETAGEVELRLADDPAYASTEEVSESRGTGEVIRVQALPLDRIWEQAGKPKISVIKLDVEGGELAALRGARMMIEAAHPLLLVEAQTAARLEGLKMLLTPLGYRYQHPSGFAPWNHVFEWVEYGSQAG